MSCTKLEGLSRLGLSRPCPLCGARSSVRHLEARGAGGSCNAVRCSSCRMVFIDPIPAAAVYPSSYGSDYYEPWGGREERARRALWSRRLAQIRERSLPGTLLDVGCGDGHFLEVAREEGWTVEGIEFSPEGARRAAQRLGRPVAVGDLAYDPLLIGPFDVITLWHVLEHLPEPSAMLEAVRARLRPGGLLVVAVPNLDNIPMRTAYRLARFRPLPLYEEGAREPHVSHFDPRTLDLLLGRSGFVARQVVPDRCALSFTKRVIDATAAILSLLADRILTDAIMAFARSPR